MNLDEFEVEDMLFNVPLSQHSCDHTWGVSVFDENIYDFLEDEYDSDDDLFNSPPDDAVDIWQLSHSSPPLEPADISIRGEDYMKIDARPDCKESVEELSAEGGKGVPRDRHWVIAHLEVVLARILDGLIDGSERLTFTLKSRAGISRRHLVTKNGLGGAPTPRIRQISFPGSTAQEALNFTILLRIIELIHGGLVDNTIMTKREIYYRQPDLFVKQAVVDRYIDDLACTLGVPRSRLNVTAAAKGLVAGCFAIQWNDGTELDGKSGKEDFIVPKIGDQDKLDLTQLHWILVVEKEATFRSIFSATQWQELGLHGLILTAKGYPDVASRNFLHQLADHAPHIPIYAFVDLDPDGIAIMSTYKYGSYRLAHEHVTPKNSPAAGLPNLRWLGVKGDHISRCSVDESGAGSCGLSGLQYLMRLTARDRTKAIRMLEWDICSETGSEQEWRRELQMMLMLNVKAEIQVLEELPGGLLSYLSAQLYQML